MTHIWIKASYYDVVNSLWQKYFEKKDENDNLWIKASYYDVVNSLYQKYFEKRTKMPIFDKLVMRARNLDCSDQILKRNMSKNTWFYLVSIHAFFYKQRFFSAQPQCCLTFSWIELQMLLRCCLIHIAIIKLWHILYLAYVSMTRVRSIYVVSIFHFQSHFHHNQSYNYIKTDTLVFTHFLEILLIIFWW